MILLKSWPKEKKSIEVKLQSKPMKFNKLSLSILFLLSMLASFKNEAFCQGLNAGEIHGNFQLDAQYYNPDSAIGALPVPEKFLMNSFTNLVGILSLN